MPVLTLLPAPVSRTPSPASCSKKLVRYRCNKASRRQMSSTLPSLPPGQMAKLDNMLSKIIPKSHGHVSVCLPVCLPIPQLWPSPLGSGVWPCPGKDRVGQACCCCCFLGTMRRPEPTSLLSLDMGALLWDIGPVGEREGEVV